MFTKRFLSHLLIAQFLVFTTFGELRSQSGHSFLINPSAESEGMGGSGVAIPMNESFGALQNPALLGLKQSKWYLRINPLSDYSYNNFLAPQIERGYALQAGMDLSQFVDGLPLSFGISHSYDNIFWGEFTRVDKDGKFVGRFKVNEKLNVLSFGVGFDWYVKLCLGASVKFLDGEIELTGTVPVNTASTSGTSYDLGALIDVPVFTELNVYDKITSAFDIYAGYSVSNLGGEIPILPPVSSQGDDYDPQQRFGRLGYGMKLEFNYTYGNTPIKLLEAKWTSQADDDMSYYNDKGNYEYKGAIGDINLMDNVILCNSTRNVQSRNGWSLTLLEIVTLSGGRRLFNINNNMNPSYATSGFGLHSAGICKILAELLNVPILSKIGEKVNIVYYHSKNEYVYLQSLSSQYNVDYSSLTITIRDLPF